MRLLRRWLILTHRFLGIGLSLLFAMWFVSGIAMVFAHGMPTLTANERLRRTAPLDISKVRVRPADAGIAGGVGPSAARVTLTTVMGRPAYRFTGPIAVTVFADTGDLLETVSRSDSLAIASRFLDLPGSSLEYIGELDEADQWTLEHRRDLPVHHIAVNDAARTEVYVSEANGEVVMRTTRGSRELAWIAAIPHWMYFTPLRLNDRLWTSVILWTSALGAFSVALGLVLGVTQYRVRYAGWMRWHYVLGVVFGVVALTWTVSGFLSMEPFEWFSNSTAAMRVPRALSGGPLDLAAFPAIDGADWNVALEGRQAREVEFRRIHGEPFYVVRLADERPLLLQAAPKPARREPFSEESILERVRQGYPQASIASVDTLSDYDAYYYDRDRDAPLPVFRITFNDPDSTWIYVDTMSQLLARFTFRERIERWIYHGFHSLDFPVLYFRRPLWEVVTIALLSGGAALSIVGVVIGFKRCVRYLHSW